MKATRVLILAAALVLLAAAPTPEISVAVVRYDELTAAVGKLRGKVVVVDFWADFCTPCKREFPQFVELHEKYKAKGLSAISVALDENTSEHRAAILQFLRLQKADFANYILDEPFAVWQSKLKIDGPPIVFVFNRQGKLARKFVDAAVDYKEIDECVRELLRE